MIFCSRRGIEASPFEEVLVFSLSYRYIGRDGLKGFSGDRARYTHELSDAYVVPQYPHHPCGPKPSGMKGRQASGDLDVLTQDPQGVLDVCAMSPDERPMRMVPAQLAQLRYVHSKNRNGTVFEEYHP
jgi:hypothetical protein